MGSQRLPITSYLPRTTERCFPPKVLDDKIFHYSYNNKYWSNNKETLQLIDGILLPYIEKIKKELNFPNN